MRRALEVVDKAEHEAPEHLALLGFPRRERVVEMTVLEHAHLAAHRSRVHAGEPGELGDRTGLARRPSCGGDRRPGGRGTGSGNVNIVPCVTSLLYRR